MARLTDYDPDALPMLVAGSVTYLRPASEWAGRDARTPAPFECWYEEAGKAKCVVWNLMNERQAAERTPVTVTGRLGGSGLPLVREDSTSGGYITFEVHGDWLEGWGKVVVTKDVCTCPIVLLLHRGCGCGQIQRERAAR